MTNFTGYEYILISIANAFGLDKLLFEERIEWTTQHMDRLEQLSDKADSRPLYVANVLALRQVQRGKPTGHLIGFDACCSGIQIMSALTGCEVGARHTGLVDPDVRADAYTTCTTFMNEELPVTVPRTAAKDALMTSFYGSKKMPKEIFGADTPELNAFYVAAQRTAPGAWELLQDLLASWQPYALKHQWKLPDGYDAVVKVMKKIESRIEVDKLNHATFTYEYFVNEGSEKGLSNVANVVHSVDAYVLRSIHRRCNYDDKLIGKLYGMMLKEQVARFNYCRPAPMETNTKFAYYVEQYERSGMPDIVIAPYINEENIRQLSDAHLNALEGIVSSMLSHAPFPVVTIHDEFKCGPNHMNHLRQHYINIFAELADSNLLSDLLSQIHGVPGTFTKLSNNLSALIRQSNYALS